MSKLKRRKTRAAKPAITDTRDSLRESCSKTSAGSSCADGGLWWDRPDLNEEERLWALTLKALCPNLQTPQEEPLPPPSSTDAHVETVSDWKWNDPEDVTEIPDLPPPSFLVHPPPVKEPTSYSPAVRDTVESGPTIITAQEPSANQESEPVCDLQTTKPGAEGSGSQPGTSKSGVISIRKSVSGGSGSKLRTSEAGGSGLELGATSVSGGSGSEPGTKSEAGRSESKLRTQSEAGGSGSELGTKPGGSGSHSKTSPGAEGSKSGLECCPMCLMPFPAGFSQMECDGHLALCLSEMNDDIIW